MIDTGFEGCLCCLKKATSDQQKLKAKHQLWIPACFFDDVTNSWCVSLPSHKGMYFQELFLCVTTHLGKKKTKKKNQKPKKRENINLSFPHFPSCPSASFFFNKIYLSTNTLLLEEVWKFSTLEKLITHKIRVEIQSSMFQRLLHPGCIYLSTSLTMSLPVEAGLLN